MKKNYLTQNVFSASVMLLFGALFLIGTFNDKTIAETLYSPDDLPVKLVTSIGIFPFFEVLVFLFGALFERALHSDAGKPAKTTECAVCILTAAVVGFIGSAAILDVDCFGAIFPTLQRNPLAISLVSLTVAYPLFFLGYRLARRTDDSLLAKRIVGLVIIMLAAFFTMEMIKNIFHRPRYRTVVLGFEGVGFVPWYKPFSGAAALAESFGIDKGEFRSFPSGHSILSISMVYALQSLPWFFPKLKGKALVLGSVGFAFGAVIMFTRMLLGAHYLSDVSAGAMIGTLFALIHTMIQWRISLKSSTEQKEVQHA